MNGLESRAEVMKLARLLDTQPDQLGYLEQLPADELRRLRGQATDALYGNSGEVLQRAAAANRLLPTKLLASMAERALGPVIVARLAGMIDPGRAVEVAERLDTEFLADVAVSIDPRRASDVIGRIPPSRVAAITEVLLEREEYVAMGMFVGHLSEECLRAALPLIGDGELLRVAFVLEDKDRIDHVIDLLPEERVAGVIAAAAREELWDEALDLLQNIGDPRRTQLLATIEALPAKVKARAPAAVRARLAASAAPALRRRKSA